MVISTAERAYTSTCAQNYKFEGKERDTETQNDDFGARYYSWRWGRWLSSDWSAVPVPVPCANLTNPQTLNLYAMVADNPESFADLDGHNFPAPELMQTLADFASGLENAWSSDNLAGVGRQDQSTTAGQAGAVVGDALATLQGVEEASAGGTAVVGGVAACGTGVGCVAGAPAAAVGSVAVVHGATTAAEGAGHLVTTAVKMLEGTSGGSRAGKPFTSKGKNEVKAENAAKNGGRSACEKCGQPTVPGQRSQSGVTPPKNETHVDHIMPKSRNGDGSPSNGQVLCRGCNLEKSDQ